MLGTQQFCVRWNSYQTNLQDVFPKLLTNEHFVDVTLACEAQMIKCHKVVLSACSTYFEQLLVHNPCQHPIIFMKDMRHGEVQALVDFMYKGEVNVSQEELASLLKAAEALQIRGLCGADRQLDGKAVSLPPETTLSDSGGRETPPAKKRRQNETKENSIPVNTSSVGSTSNETPAATATQPLFKDSESANSSKEDDDKGSIKKEHFDIDDSYYDNDGDDALDLQDDSNSMNQEMSMPTSPLDQAGPSGMSGNPVDKAAADHFRKRILDSRLQLDAVMQELSRVEHVQVTDGGPFDAEIANCFPLRSIPEVDAMESRLRDDYEFKDRAIIHFSSFGGGSMNEAIRRLCSKVMSDECAISYSWQGRKGNLEFENLLITGVMWSAIKRIPEYNFCTKNAISKVVGPFLNRAKDRLSQKIERAAKRREREAAKEFQRQHAEHVLRLQFA